jgi:hypothetical protein
MKLELISSLNESTQYRSKHAIKQTDARSVCDFAFMDMIAIWILFNEYDFAPTAMSYAERTVTFNRFDNYRQMGTDLYLNMHVITQKRADMLGSPNDSVLLDRISVDVPNVVRYLRKAAGNNLTQSFARQTLQRLEGALYVNNSNYRSIRRLAQNWPSLTTGQKRAVLTRMLMFYQMNARRSEIYASLKALAKSQGLEDKSAKNPERPSFAKKAAAGAAAGAAGFAAGYQLGKKLV